MNIGVALALLGAVLAALFAGIGSAIVWAWPARPPQG